MTNIKLDENSIFSINETNLLGKETGRVITSYRFIIDGIKKLNENKDLPTFESHLYEYSSILKRLVKNEMIEQMKKGIEDIDTFYN